MTSDIVSTAAAAIVSVLFVTLINVNSSMAGTKCLKDNTLPDYPINVYYCNETTTTACCTDSTGYSCCVPAATTTWQNLVILFGGIFGFVSLFLLVWVCYRKDLDVCHRFRWHEHHDNHHLVKCTPCCYKVWHYCKKVIHPPEKQAPTFSDVTVTYPESQGIYPASRAISPGPPAYPSQYVGMYTDVEDLNETPGYVKEGETTKKMTWEQRNEIFQLGLAGAQIM